MIIIVMEEFVNTVDAYHVLEDILVDIVMFLLDHLLDVLITITVVNMAHVKMAYVYVLIYGLVNTVIVHQDHQ
jgi:hypothetical protein